MNSNNHPPQGSTVDLFANGDEIAEQTQARGGHLVSTILSPALSLWLRSQIDQVEHLKVNIYGGDRQVLTGYIPGVSILAENLVYQGLHFHQVRLFGTDIRINLGQVLRGKPLRLLQVVPVKIAVILDQTDLNASLQTSIFADAVNTLFQQLVQSSMMVFPNQSLSKGSLITNLNSPIDRAHLESPLQILIGENQVTLTSVTEVNQCPCILSLQTQLDVIDGHILRLKNPEWRSPLNDNLNSMLSNEALQDFDLDFGSDVQVHHLSLQTHRITCQGMIRVIPGE